MTPIERISATTATRLSIAAETIERDWPVGDAQVLRLVEDLRRNDARTRFGLGVARAGIWEAELFTGQVDWSDTMPLAIGWPPSRAGGTLEGMTALLHPDDRRKFIEVISGPFDASKEFRVDLRVPSPSGRVRWVRFCGQVRSDDDGMSVRLVSVAQDITEQKELEEKLNQAQKMEAMGRLAGGVAHDFNNILTAILGYAVLIEGEDEAAAPATEPQAHAVQIRRAAERAAALTKQLLAFSRKQVPERRAVALGQLIADLLPMLGKLAGEQVEIVPDLSDNVYPVHADTGHLQQVIMNLAINACDAMPGGGQLRLRTSNVTLTGAEQTPRFDITSGDYALLTVTDTGAGMDAGTRARIFEPFFTTKAEGQGTGLGLSTVFEIVKSLGGAIRVSSEVGKGTTFRIYLPRTGVVAAIQEVAAPVPVVGGCETVLVVEDEPGVRLLVRDILQRHGYAVLEAADAENAHAIVTKSACAIDLIVADVMMPNGTGPELVASLHCGGKDVPALYMSGYAGAALLRQGKLAAQSEFLQKPFTAPQLLGKVRGILDAVSV